MTDNVIPLGCITTLDLPPEKLLAAAIEHGVTDVIVIGRGKDGELWVSACDADAGHVLVMLELAKADLLRRVE